VTTSRPPITPAAIAEWRRRREASTEPLTPPASEEPGNGLHTADGNPANGPHPADGQPGNGLRHVNGQPLNGHPPAGEPSRTGLYHANEQPGNGHRPEGDPPRNGYHLTAHKAGPQPSGTAAVDFAASQQAGLDALRQVSLLTTPGHDLGSTDVTYPGRPDGRHNLDGGSRHLIDIPHPRGVAPRERRRGALNSDYDIPDVVVKRVRKVPYALLATIAAAIGLSRHAMFINIFEHYRVLMASWTVIFILALAQWVLSLWDRPYVGWSARLDLLRVVVSLPVYNEDAPTLDRVLYALARQTRLPDVVHVVDDGSRVSYAELRHYWERDPVLGPRLLWTRQANAGKKRAQAACFTAHPDADIFITLDSDTTLAGSAIEEGLRPFISRDVYSVAGLELAWNHSKNWLTLMAGSRTLSWQLLSCAAQNVAGGDVTVNRGTFALYRAGMIRDIVPAYIGETFLGRPIKLGDDAALTLFAECRGRAVQQPTAVCLAMYPENLRHHLRQWTRWMRGSTIRTCWRLRYLPLTSYTWWYTFLTTWSFIAAIGALVAAIITWPHSEVYVATAGLAMIGWSILMAMRTTTVHRSDQSWLDRVIVVLMAPVTALWVTFVLRPVRVYGIATCLRQGWITRSEVEIVTDEPSDAAATPLAVEGM
jgi:hyaluronan synthase